MSRVGGSQQSDAITLNLKAAHRRHKHSLVLVFQGVHLITEV